MSSEFGAKAVRRLLHDANAWERGIYVDPSGGVGNNTVKTAHITGDDRHALVGALSELVTYTQADMVGGLPSGDSVALAAEVAGILGLPLLRPQKIVSGDEPEQYVVPPYVKCAFEQQAANLTFVHDSPDTLPRVVGAINQDPFLAQYTGAIVMPLGRPDSWQTELPVPLYTLGILPAPAMVYQDDPARGELEQLPNHNWVQYL